MGFFFLLIHGLALLTMAPFEAAGVKPAFEKPNDPMNLVVLLGMIAIITITILFIARYWKKQLIQIIILAAVGYASFYVLFPLISLILRELPSLVISLTFATLILALLLKYPEWYIVDACGTLIGAGAIAIFGMSLDIYLVILFLIVLSVYDAISVYKTKHMIDIADTAMSLRLPILLIIPKVKGYSFLKEKGSFKEKMERDAFFMGLGDVVMPGILVASTYYNIGLFTAFLVILGTLLGFAILMLLVVRGRPQAGLPCLCGGAILGYLISTQL
jgi:presenilin-like A22 family membrane protease